MGMTVGDVASLAGISIRALHHYDRLGLLSPSERSDAGYRLYTDENLATLQQVLFYRELGFSLEDIREVINDPEFDRFEALVSQRRLLAEKAEHLAHMIDAIDKAIDGAQKGITMNKEEMFEVFGDFDPSEHEKEAEERWGETDAYQESARRSARYSKEDWARFKAESDQINTDTAALMDAGVPATDPRAMDLAEQARLQIDTWFYPCSHEMHVNLAEMYIADPRFTATYETIHEGMALYWHDAIIANAQR
ncbi:MAG: MerR family transcriptional regulator [Coriobacteriia bacterium]|nr:MerR family transcriptional regulator [Coriobacteriia bacterium]MBN2822861.1 MerR family transcriptional regulator [Coriobacteriia bacterium]